MGVRTGSVSSVDMGNRMLEVLATSQNKPSTSTRPGDGVEGEYALGVVEIRAPSKSLLAQ